MCGIAGIKLFNKLASKTEEELLLRALAKQHHRGPDSTNVQSASYAALGHNRLSIIDTQARSNQPFSNQEKRYFLVFNGEIYNFHALKNDLLAKGYQFMTSSDTEVLYYHLIEHGKDGLSDLMGCFAFSFYDAQEDYMLLARDRMGINPLLFAFEEHGLVFASELEAFPELNVGQTISDQALNYYFQYTYIPAPFTIYEEVQKLPPAHYIELKGTRINISSYWSLKPEVVFQGSYEEARKGLKAHLEFAVVSQLEADVPIGTFLSGGVDSSLVSAIAAQHKDDLHTFSVSFGDQKRFDESQYALQVAKHIGSRHHVIRLEEKDFKREFHAILDSFDEPFADSSAIAMWFLAQETSKHVKVALSGDGADELLGGYNKHRAFQQAESLSNLKKGLIQLTTKSTSVLLRPVKPKKAKQLLKYNQLVQLYWPENYWFLASNIGEETKNKLLNKNFRTNPIYTDKYQDLNDFLAFDQQFVLPNDMLKKVDLMSMRHSLEVRTPFMDEKLVHYINALPASWKLKGSTGKYILKDAFRDLLPDTIFSRSKQGFEVPVNAWIRSNWDELIPPLWFDQDFIKKQAIFDYNQILTLKNKFYRNDGTSSQAIWAYFVFQHWYLNKHQHA